MSTRDHRIQPERGGRGDTSRPAPSAALALAALCVSATTQAQTWVEITPAGGPLGTNTGWTQGVCYDPGSNRLTVYIPSVPGTFPSAVWVMTHANGQGGPAAWTQLAPTGNAPDDFKGAGIACDAANNRLIVYGGCLGYCTSTSPAVRVLNHANGLGGTPAWSLDTVGTPRARTGHSAVLDVAGDRLITFAGADATAGTNQSDVAVLSNASGNTSPSVWTTLTPPPPLPSPREFHRAIYDAAHNTMLVFGGRKVTTLCCPAVVEDYNDLWVLAHANGTGGTPTWTQVTPVGTPPVSRSSHSATYDGTRHRLVVFGGTQWNPIAGSWQNLSDLWVLTDADGIAGTPTWTQLSSTGTPPALGLHGAALDEASDQLIVAGAAPDLAIRVWVRGAPLPVDLSQFAID